MVHFWQSNQDHFDIFWQSYKQQNQPNHDPELTVHVTKIIDDVRRRGDEALLHYTRTWDHADIASMADIIVGPGTLEAAYRALPNHLQNALKIAKQRIVAYHEKQMPASFTYRDEHDVLLGNWWTAIESVGIYVPGGKAIYPSSVLMNAVPARVAGVGRIAMVVPAPSGVVDPILLAAAHIADIDHVYMVGGAQAVAALAYGTKTIAAVDKIVGPGNRYVAEAKRQLFGIVGIDMVAGPSEIVVLADHSANPYWLAADLLSQAEHDEAARAMLLTTDLDIAKETMKLVDQCLQSLPRAAIASSSWHQHGLVLVCQAMDEMIDFANELAGEHVELMVENPHVIAKQIRHAGALFLGPYTPEAIGDYLAGPSHVLPTSGTARFSSGLSVFDFMRRISVMESSLESLRSLGNYVVDLANVEGLNAHGLSVLRRLETIEK
jgi:histidinol dehydrogenase